MNVRFIYKSNNYNRERELVLTNICTIASVIIALPDTIEVEFTKLDRSVYAETVLDHRFRNRIRLEETLSSKEIINPVIHELLHLNQTHTGRLIAFRNGVLSWDKRFYNMKSVEMTPEVWANLPWEQDVVNKQQFLLEKVLDLGLLKG